MAWTEAHTGKPVVSTLLVDVAFPGAHAMPAEAASTSLLMVRAHGLQVAELARVLPVPAPDGSGAPPVAAPSRAEALATLYARGGQPAVRNRALNAMVDEANAQWPAGFRARFLRPLLRPVLEAARRWQVMPSVTLAQAILESGWGRSKLAQRYHNLFGIKAGASSQRVTLLAREHSQAARRPTKQGYRVFEDQGQAIEHHAQLLGTDSRYANARSSWTDWRAYLQAISKTYASDPGYAGRVSRIVELYDLDRWDPMIAEAAAFDSERRPD